MAGARARALDASGRRARRRGGSARPRSRSARRGRRATAARPSRPGRRRSRGRSPRGSAAPARPVRLRGRPSSAACRASPACGRTGAGARRSGRGRSARDSEAWKRRCTSARPSAMNPAAFTRSRRSSRLSGPSSASARSTTAIALSAVSRPKPCSLKRRAIPACCVGAVSASSQGMSSRAHQVDRAAVDPGDDHGAIADLAMDVRDGEPGNARSQRQHPGAEILGLDREQSLSDRLGAAPRLAGEQLGARPRRPQFDGPQADDLRVARRQLGVAPAEREQLVVRAALDDAAAVEHHDLVGVADGRQPVGDRDRRPALGELVQRLLHRALGLGVQRARRLVEHQHRRVAQHRAGDRDALLLAAGEAVAALADDGVVAVGQRGDQLVDLRGARGGLDLGVGGLRAGEAQVLADRGVEQVGLLRDERRRVAASDAKRQRRARRCRRSSPRPRSRVVQARDEVAERGLAASRSRRRSPACVPAGTSMVDVLERRRSVGVVAEPDVLEAHLAAHVARARRRPRARDVDRQVEVLEDAVEQRERGLDVDADRQQRLDREQQARLQRGERDDVPIEIAPTVRLGPANQ